MAQLKLTAYFPQIKAARRRDAPAVKHKAGSGAGTGWRRKAVPPAPVGDRDSRPPAFIEAPELQGGLKAEAAAGRGGDTPPTQGGSALESLVTPVKGEQAGPGADSGAAGPGPGADGTGRRRRSTAKKRHRSEPTDEGEPAGPRAQRPRRVPSARRCLVLQPDEALQHTGPLSEASEAPDSPAHETTILNQGISNFPRLQNLSRNSQQVLTVPKKEGLSALKSQLQRIRKFNHNAKLLVPSELSTDTKNRLKLVRELQSKVQENKEQKKTKEQDEKLGVDERVKAPAYQRFHNLAQDVPPGLALPFKYKVLAEMFRCMDTVVSILFNRLEIITFAKVKQGVQDMMRKQFEQRNIGQIKTVYPSGYKFRQEKGIRTWNDCVKKSSYQLTIDPVFEGEENSEGHTQLTASLMLQRRRIFIRNLTNLVKQYHKIFLASLNPPMYVPDDKLTRWHPRFNVDEVPDIVAAELPQPPDFKKLTTAQEVLDKAHSMMSSKMEKALANMALKSVETVTAANVEQKEQNVTNPCPSPGSSNALKGISQSLLERIRSKEAQKIQAAMTRNMAQTERLHMMMRLPEITRILRNVFVAEKKPALNITVACNRVVDSYRSAMTLVEMEKHLRLLATIVPDWLNIHIIRKDVYIKLNKNVELSIIVEKIAKKIKEEEKV
ncbi:DNA replication factor Cdt1 [Narcine bancroftii]|uniref:DNA replication factor Cdt1 n=1 Tax=Narcine bancroftii TaxID=1343680 RepID=UPI0038320F6C